MNQQKNQLEQLREMTVVVADTGDFESLQHYKPTDSTTNPTLILDASQKENYKHLVDEAVNFGKKQGKTRDESIHLALDKVFVNFGCEILKIIPGRVSTEVDARLSFDVEGSMKKARKLVSFYEKEGIERERLLIKLASTWEGVLAAKELEKENIHCNMTLLFSLPQAIACAEANATLISPFVGRILDWYKKSENKESYPPEEDPGVLSVQSIYQYFKTFGYSTEIMGASFRNKEEILELAGCDLLTISPKLLEELTQSKDTVTRKLDPKVKDSSLKKMTLDEKTFRFMVNENAMATEKLAEGIRKFSADIVKLQKHIEEKMK